MESYFYRTAHGEFLIRQQGARYAVFFRGMSLDGTFHSAQSALDDLLQGTLRRSPALPDPAALGVPPSLLNWQKRSL